MEQCSGKSVGAIIRNEKGWPLCVYRLVKPMGIAIPAGHYDSTDTSPEEAMKREVEEETGLVVINYKLILHEILPDQCSRGTKEHEWFVYLVDDYRDQPQNRESDRHSFVNFLPVDKLGDYFAKRLYNPVLFEQILPRIALNNLPC